MPQTKQVLFLCTGNSCRSQMAEGFARAHFGAQLAVFSAGTRPGRLDPRAVAVMHEAGIDITGQVSKHVDVVAHVAFDLVVTVCDAAREACPVLPQAARIVHRGFADPPALAVGAANEAEILQCYRNVRDQIERFVKHELPILLKHNTLAEEGR